MSVSRNLLDEALGLENGVWSRGHVVLVEDCVETNGAFVLHHLLKRALVPERTSVVIFVSLAYPFFHYDRILRKLGCNLMAQKDSNRFVFLDMLKLECPGEDGNNITEGGLIGLYGKIQRAVEVNSLPECNRGFITIMIDDVSLLDVAAHGSVDYVLDFLHYCRTLTSELDCSLFMLNHEDIYSSMAGPRLISQLEYLADIVIKAEPLATGLATDVHGQLTVVNRGILNEDGHSSNKIRNFHFKIKENTVEYFYPGTRT
ncbi:elongator complex protein 6-like isoform X2 [Tasmannia lanceolata]|uniref:elongator complex protein 6-like isoform X2 n=1 Tax=Tasmannia lanceolata TaxID=3420 RepID=UPI0040640458